MSVIEVTAFKRFHIAMPLLAAQSCWSPTLSETHLDYWCPRIPRPAECGPGELAAELRDIGVEPSADDGANWRTIVRLASAKCRFDSQSG